MADYLGRKQVREGLTSIFAMAGKSPPAEKIVNWVHGILFIIVVLFILGSLIWVCVEVGDATIWRSSPVPTTQMVFNNSTVTVNAGVASSSQPVISTSTPTTTATNTIYVYRTPLTNNKTPPPLLLADNVPLKNKKMSDGYHNEIVIALGVAIGTGAPIINSIIPNSVIQSCNSLGSSQPGVALNGSMSGRIVYFFQFDCVSKEPIATGTPISFGLNYSWQSLQVNSTTQ